LRNNLNCTLTSAFHSDSKVICREIPYFLYFLQKTEKIQSDRLFTKTVHHKFSLNQIQTRLWESTQRWGRVLL